MKIRITGRIHNPSLPRGNQWQRVELAAEIPEKVIKPKKKAKR